MVYGILPTVFDILLGNSYIYIYIYWLLLCIKGHEHGVTFAIDEAHCIKIW